MKIYHVDAFSDKMFMGNPAGVCILNGPADEQWMQNIAMEINVSETAFLYKAGDGYNLRWFTPEVEVDLCGHATLASAHILWETGALEEDHEAVFNTKSGKLTAKKDGDYIILNFPVEAETLTEAPNELINALGDILVKYTGRNRMDYIVEVENEEIVRKLQPDHRALKNIDTRGVIVTSRSDDPQYDFVSRFFVPGAGIDEDPVTGSAHCCLGPYWAERLGKTTMNAYQASKRGGVLQVTVNGDRVHISGRAVTVFCAELGSEKTGIDTGLREIHPDDYAQMLELWDNTPGMGVNEADSENNIRKFLLRNPGLSFCYKEGNKIVGTSLCGHDNRRGYIYHTAVLPEYRGKGIGKMLVEKNLEQLKATGIEKCHLFVFADNELGNDFWSSTGWTRRNDIFLYSRNT